MGLANKFIRFFCNICGETEGTFWPTIHFYFLLFAYTGSSLPHRLFSNCSEWGLLSWQASHGGGFSCEAGALGPVSFSGCGSWSPEHRLSSRARAWLLLGVWNLPGPGVELQFLALAGNCQW